MVVLHNGIGILGRSGVERYSRELLRHLPTAAPDIQNELLVRRNRADDYRQALGEYSQLTYRDILPSDVALGESLRSVTRFAQQRIWKACSSRADVVHLHTIGNHMPAIEGAVVTIHDLFPLDAEYGANAQLRSEFPSLVDHAVRTASAILVPSRYVATTIIERFPQCEHTITVTPLACSDEFKPRDMSDATREMIGLKDSDYVLYVGRVDERKNLSRQIEAYTSLPDSIRSSCPFYLLLSNVDDSAKMYISNRIAAWTALNIRIVADPQHHVVYEVMANARALCFATLGEGFGLPVVEAMASGTPVITSNVTALPEVAGDAAWYVNPYDVDAISAALESIITDDTTYIHMRDAGFRQAGRFSWHNTASITASVYRSLGAS